jgi:multidrug efflux pump subunit AcrB
VQVCNGIHDQRHVVAVIVRVARRRFHADTRRNPQLAKVSGITLFMQPVQDLTVEDRTSRTRSQYRLEDPNADELNTYARRIPVRLQPAPELRDVPSGQTLCDSYGQREIAVMLTQLNHYHVGLELKPESQRNHTGYPSGSSGLASGGISLASAPTGPVSGCSVQKKL